MKRVPRADNLYIGLISEGTAYKASWIFCLCVIFLSFLRRNQLKSPSKCSFLLSITRMLSWNTYGWISSTAVSQSQGILLIVCFIITLGLAILVFSFTFRMYD